MIDTLLETLEHFSTGSLNKMFLYQHGMSVKLLIEGNSLVRQGNGFLCISKPYFVLLSHRDSGLESLK